jgi:hypothetical protein
MTEHYYKARDLRQHDNWLEIQHHRAVDRSATAGDTTFEFTAELDTFKVSGSEYRGRDRDNYDYSHETEIDLNEEEARELHLLLTVWLEQRTK